ncbi:MAG: tripartite tricarboxylate transporter TctB family protein [Hyphomicrobiales bacterium]|nr:tripartite tricarboxylate transporter TctB family protein [Hyphomicrobiales bacterium]
MTDQIPLLRRQDFIGGLIIIAVGLFALWQGADLPMGSLEGVGPGMLPRGLAVLLALLGATLSLSAVFEVGLPLGRWSIRGPLFVLGAMLAFALSVRPLGLIVAGPMVVVIGSFASDEARPLETAVFGVAMTVFCIGLFKYALGLPIPLAPWLLGY